MKEALCRPSGTTLDTMHDEDGPPITQRASGLEASIDFFLHSQSGADSALNADRLTQAIRYEVAFIRGPYECASRC